MSVSRKRNRSKSKSRRRRGGGVDASTSMTPPNSPRSPKKNKTKSPKSPKKTKTKKVKSPKSPKSPTSPKRRGKPSILTRLLGEYKEPRYGKKGSACAGLNEPDCEKHSACDYVTKLKQCRKKRSA